MAGIYIHIPFCRKACHYCDFHFSTSLRQQGEMITAITNEIRLQESFLEGLPVETIYFGGGTPSLLSFAELSAIFNAVYKSFSVVEGAEITLEANPDNLTPEYLQMLKLTPVNRLSIGVQSFMDADLHFMNRAHNAAQSMACITHSQDAGFQNITIDLIYGTPTLSNSGWVNNLEKVFELGIQHLSCYCLTVEKGTALYKFVKSGQTPDVDEDKASTQFIKLMEMAEDKGFQQYEISNFCLPDHYSRHNSNYWKGEKFLGIGPSAHSFNGSSRQYNVANNSSYLKSIYSGVIPAQTEVLSIENRYNEYVLTSLRTMWGTDMRFIKDNFDSRYYAHIVKEAQPFIISGHLSAEDNMLTLSREGKLLADHIAKHLFA